MRLLMCRPDFYGVEYEINPWMDVRSQVTHQVAVKEWDTLYQTLINCGAQVDLVAPEKGWPDMVFTANAGLWYKGQIILSYFKFKERQGEMPYFKKWFSEVGFSLLNDAANVSFFEGAGDALAAGNKLFAGYGFRSERRFYEEAAYLNKNDLVYCELSNPYFYHLDTCFCPLTDKLAIWYPPAFTAASQENMAKEIDLIEVKENEAKRFACNAVVLDQHVILANGCPDLSKQLEKRGFSVQACEMNEYIKAGGACKCLTLRLD